MNRRDFAKATAIAGVCLFSPSLIAKVQVPREGMVRHLPAPTTDLGSFWYWDVERFDWSFSGQSGYQEYTTFIKFDELKVGDRFRFVHPKESKTAGQVETGWQRVVDGPGIDSNTGLHFVMVEPWKPESQFNGETVSLEY